MMKLAPAEAKAHIPSIQAITAKRPTPALSKHGGGWLFEPCQPGKGQTASPTPAHLVVERVQHQWHTHKMVRRVRHQIILKVTQRRKHLTRTPAQATAEDQQQASAKHQVHGFKQHSVCCHHVCTGRSDHVACVVHGYDHEHGC